MALPSGNFGLLKRDRLLQSIKQDSRSNKISISDNIAFPKNQSSKQHMSTIVQTLKKPP